MYVRRAALTGSVRSVVHHFLSPGVDATGYKLQPAGPGYESVWGTTAVGPYVRSLTEKGTLAAGFTAMHSHDEALAGQLLAFLAGEKCFARGVRVVGSARAGSMRMPTVSFVVTAGSKDEPAMKSKEVVDAFDKYGTVSAWTVLSRLTVLDWYSLWPFLCLQPHSKSRAQA
jgi:hypothetical protein